MWEFNSGTKRNKKLSNLQAVVHKKIPFCNKIINLRDIDPASKLMKLTKTSHYMHNHLMVPYSFNLSHPVLCLKDIMLSSILCRSVMMMRMDLQVSPQGVSSLFKDNYFVTVNYIHAALCQRKFQTQWLKIITQFENLIVTFHMGKYLALSFALVTD